MSDAKKKRLKNFEVLEMAQEKTIENISSSFLLCFLFVSSNESYYRQIIYTSIDQDDEFSKSQNLNN